MEQHNIDSRFKKGLENLDRQPSSDAWARLQARMQEPQEEEAQIINATEEKKEERRILVWWHYAAAAVVLLIISVGIFKNGSNFGGKTEMPVAVNKAPQATEKTVTASKVTTPASEETSEQENLVAAVETQEKAIKPETSLENAIKNGSKTAVKTTFSETQKTQLAQVTKKVKAEKLTDKTSVQEKNQPNLQLVKQEEVIIASNQTIQAEKAQATETKPALLSGMVIEVIVKKDNSENAVALAESAEDTDKDSKLKNIFKQARNLKNGESVDLQAIGLTADSKLAMGTRNITQKFSKALDI